MATIMGALKAFIALGLVVWIAMFVLDTIGPTEPVSETPQFSEAEIGPDVAAWIAEREAQVPDLRDGAAREIVWAGEPGARTPLAVVYLHGFFATKEEARPLPDRVADEIGANLYFTRLSGHGRDGAALAEPDMQDWVDDVAEAMAVGRALGERVVLIGTSTGGTLATLAAARPELNEGLAGVVLMSPNFRAAGWAGRVIEWPGVRNWAPALAGAERSWTPHNDAHAANWTTRYPTETVATLGALTHYVRNLNLAEIETPALFLVATDDTVIDPVAARRAAARWGGPSELVPVVLGPEDDPARHILAGNILSPSRTEPMTARIVAWIRGL